jgi:hypothetical protein
MTATQFRKRWSAQSRQFSSLIVSAILLFAAGCGEELQTSYGGRAGPYDGPSVNGTSVLSDMLERARHSVVSRTSLSPGLEESADVILWFPDDFRPPPPAVRRWLEKWLTAKGGRTVVFVGRDFDAACAYWRAVEPTAPPAQAAEVKRRRVNAETAFNRDRGGIFNNEDADWFTVKTLAKPRTVTTLAGPWSAGVDPKKCEIELYSTHQFSPGDQVLLQDNVDTLVSRRQYFSADSWSGAVPQSKLIVITNGAFLLNLQLVNHEHRKLAAHLLRELPPSARVVFLESGPGGPPIRESEPVARTPNGLEVFSIWPIGAVLLHLGAVGILFCFARLPIFGVPRDPPAISLSDFGKHVSAFGEMLHLTRDRNYATARIEQYRQTVRGEGTAGNQKTKRRSAT